MTQRASNVSTSVGSVDAQEQLAALWSIIRRHPGIIVTSLLASLILGTLYYLRAPRTYESRAQVQIITKRFSVSGDEEERKPTKDQTIETHKVVISSPNMIERALTNYQLDQLTSLRDETNPVQTVLDNLDAGVKEENTTVVELAYRAGNDEDCQKVLDAILASYSDHLSEANQEIGKEAMELIAKAKDDLLEQLNHDENEHGEFQKAAPIMWRDGQGVNIHHERQLQIEEARKELLVTRSIIDAKLRGLESAIEKGTMSHDGVYFEALKELSLDDTYQDWRTAQIAEQEQFAERAALREYAAILVGEFVRLSVEESEKLDSFGDGHPDVESITKRKNRVQEMLLSMQNDKLAVSHELLGVEPTKSTTEKKDYVQIFLQTLRDRLVVIDQQLDSLDDQFAAEQKKANVMQEYILTDRRFRNNLERTKDLFNVVVARLREINILRDAGGETMLVLQRPALGEQVAPALLIVLLGSGLLGALSGCVLAYVVDHAERTFRSWSEIRQTLDLPVIGGVPVLNHSRKSIIPEFAGIPATLCTIHDEGSPQSEAFRGVRTNLYYSTSGQNYKLIQVTSPLLGDGKSTLTANLAVTIAKSGKRVLILDADFRRPTMSHLLGLSAESSQRPGLGSVISGTGSYEDALIETVIDNLFVIPAGERPRQPSELLTTQRFTDLLKQVRKQFDFVLIDTPPLLPVTDPSIVAAQVDGVLLALRIRRGTRVAAQRAVERLRALNANILGVVVNGWEVRGFAGDRSYEFGYGFANGYGYDRQREIDGDLLDSLPRRTNGKRRQPSSIVEPNPANQ